MDLHIQYLTDKAGVKKAVQIPYDEWLKFSSRHKHLMQYSKIKRGFDAAFKEIEQIKTNRTKKITLEELLDEG